MCKKKHLKKIPWCLGPAGGMLKHNVFAAHWQKPCSQPSHLTLSYKGSTVIVFPKMSNYCFYDFGQFSFRGHLCGWVDPAGGFCCMSYPLSLSLSFLSIFISYPIYKKKKYKSSGSFMLAHTADQFCRVCLRWAKLQSVAGKMLWTHYNRSYYSSSV